MRHIRLKENPPGAHEEHYPGGEYRQFSDDTLGPGPFVKDVDADGFLMTKNSRPDAARNLVMLGGSFVESVFAAERQRFASITERALPPEWRVLNAGYSGMTTIHQLTVLATKIPPYVADSGKLVIFVGQSDTVAVLSDGSYWDSTPRITPVQPARPDVAMPWSAEESVERGVDALLSVAEAFALDYGVVAAPFRDADFSTDRPLRATYRRNRDQYVRYTALRRHIHKTARDAAANRDRPFFDGQALVEPSDFYDAMHLNNDGQQRFADDLTAWLRTWAVASE